MIDPGQLTERVRIEQAVEVRNSFGETVQSWQTFADRWASVDTLSSREFLLQGKQQTEATHRVRMRFVTGLTSTMRIMWRGKTLEIISLLEQYNRSRHELLCIDREEAPQ